MSSHRPQFSISARKRFLSFILIIVCNRGRYGPNCMTRCSQNCMKQECNNIDGRCTDGCIPGWTGESCQQSI